jgi:hypothetical protein
MHAGEAGVRRKKADGSSLPTPVGLGLRALRGGSVVVGVAVDGGSPRVVLSTFLPTAAEGDRLSLEPYHVAAEMVRDQGATPAQAAAAVGRGRRRQDELAAKGLEESYRKLEAAGCTPVVAALLVNRAGWVSDLLQFSLAFPDHPPVAEGLAVREALRHALGQRPLRLLEMDEKSLPEKAGDQLALRAVDIETRLRTLGAAAGRPWRKEQKLACLSAWVAMAAQA